MSRPLPAPAAESRSATDTMRSRWTLMEKGFTPLNGAKEPLVNKFIKFCNGAKIKFLARWVFMWIIASSLLISYIFKRRGCVGADVSFGNCVLLVLSMLIGGGGPEISQTDCCPALSVAAATISFLTDSMVIAVFVNRITSPKTKISISNVMLLKMRNSALLFQIRIMNEYGHPLENVSVHASLYKSAVSEEGERFTHIYPVEFQCNYVCHAPINISHFIDDSSPFYGQDLENLSGSLEVSVSAKDSVLDAGASCTMFYDRDVLLVAHDFESVFIERPVDTIGDAPFVVDAAKLSKTTPLPSEISDKIHNAITINKFTREQFGTVSPNVPYHGMSVADRPRSSGRGILNQEYAVRRHFTEEGTVMSMPVQRTVSARGPAPSALKKKKTGMMSMFQHR